MEHINCDYIEGPMYNLQLTETEMALLQQIIEDWENIQDQSLRLGNVNEYLAFRAKFF